MSKHVKTVISSDHIYDPRTGFCEKCGNHHEMIRMDNMLCMYSDNTIAISHRRALMRKEQADQKAEQLRDKLRLLAKTLAEQKARREAERAAQSTLQDEPA